VAGGNTLHVMTPYGKNTVRTTLQQGSSGFRARGRRYGGGLSLSGGDQVGNVGDLKPAECRPDLHDGAVDRDRSWYR
jgi:hypothetical protein